ncbi:MAG: TorF family putative porin [Hyphomicrobiaceae bacterium]|nr:TorF family putative porin [Hyphomicrobiaceae bacterium]
MKTTLFALAALGLAATSMPALAADLTAEETAVEPSMFDVAFGVTLTSDYVWRGISQTDSGPAVQAYLEATYGIFYVGAWASNIDYGAGTPDIEVDLYAGIRPEFAGISFDLGAIYYVYPSYTGTWNFYELLASASYSPIEWLSLSITGNYVPDQDNVLENGHVAVGAEVTLPYDFTLSGSVGIVEDFGSGYGDWTYWNIGLGYAVNDYVSLDLRYWDTDIGRVSCGGSECAPRVVGSITVETSWSALPH